MEYDENMDGYLVRPWRDGDVPRQECVAGLLRAESKSRRLKGQGGMPSLLKALDELVRGEPTGSERGEV
jgi:hypothetical protein